MNIKKYLFRGLSVSSAKWIYKDNFLKANLKNQYHAKFVFPYFSVENSFHYFKENSIFQIEPSINIRNFKLSFFYHSNNFPNQFEKENLSGSFSISKIPVHEHIFINGITLSSNKGLLIEASTPLYDGKCKLLISKNPLLSFGFKLQAILFNFKISNSNLDISSTVSLNDEYSLLLDSLLYFPNKSKQKNYSWNPTVSFMHPMYSLSFSYDTTQQSFFFSALGKYEDFSASYTTCIKD